MIAPSSRKLWFSETTHFLKSTQTALESSKIDIFQKWLEKVLGYVSRCLVSKFEPKSPKGSVPNGQSWFAARDAIRWFKCKLKPPNNLRLNKGGFFILYHDLQIYKKFFVWYIMPMKKFDKLLQILEPILWKKNRRFRYPIFVKEQMVLTFLSTSQKRPSQMIKDFSLTQWSLFNILI